MPQRRKPRVAVLGLMPRQVAEVQARVGKIADLQFLERERNPGKFPTSAEAVVFMTKFTDHTWYSAAQRIARGRKNNPRNGSLKPPGSGPTTKD